MNTNLTALARPSKRLGLIVVGLTTAGAIVAWAASPKLVTKAAAVETSSPFDVSHKGDIPVLPSDLVGSYEVSGTDTEGNEYVRSRRLDITLAPSGALELQWDKGKNVGIAQVIRTTLAVATWSKDRTVILTMQVHSDGSLSGTWLRRTDRGSKGTENWKRI